MVDSKRPDLAKQILTSKHIDRKRFEELKLQSIQGENHEN